MSELVVVEQRIVVFYDDEIPAVLVEEDGETAVYVPIRPLCNFLGVTWDPQRRKVNRDPVLSSEVKGVTVTVTPGGRQEMVCLPLRFVNGFLFGISALRVKEEIKERLVRYQRECYEVLAEAFQATPPAAVDLDSETVSLEQLHAMAKMIAHTTGQMLENKRRLNRAAQVVRGIDQRLRVVEQRTSAGPLTAEQAQQIKQLVNSIALKMSESEPGKAHFQAVYAALAAETGAPSYKQIPPKGYAAAVAFLSSWLEAM